MIKDKTITISGWKILMDKLSEDKKRCEKSIEEWTHPEEMNRDDYDSDESFNEDKGYYYGKSDLIYYIKELIEFINEGGK